MDRALIVVLVLLWAAVLLPGALRARRRSTMNSVHGFGRAMAVLKQDRGRQVLSVKQAPHISGPIPIVGAAAPPTRRSPMQARRRRNLLTLIGGSVSSLLLGLVVGGPFLALWLVTTAALGSYVAWLRNLHVQQMQAEEIVAELADLREARELARSSSRPIARAVGD